MSLTDKLRDLDQKFLPGTREPDEDAETYLRRVAASRAITPAQAGDVMAALRVYFDVQPGPDDDEQSGDEQKDEAAESAGEEKDEADEKSSDDEESEEKSEDES